MVIQKPQQNQNAWLGNNLNMTKYAMAPFLLQIIDKFKGDMYSVTLFSAIFWPQFRLLPSRAFCKKIWLDTVL